MRDWYEFMLKYVCPCNPVGCWSCDLKRYGVRSDSQINIHNWFIAPVLTLRVCLVFHYDSLVSACLSNLPLLNHATTTQSPCVSVTLCIFGCMCECFKDYLCLFESIPCCSKCGKGLSLSLLLSPSPLIGRFQKNAQCKPNFNMTCWIRTR